MLHCSELLTFWRGLCKLKEKTIIRSPHAYDPFKAMLMTEAERNELYSGRVDQLKQPYTVIDVLQKVYHRDLKEDLTGYIKKCPHILDSIKKTSDEWVMSECRLKKFRIIQIESVFGQPVEEFMVDILCEAEFGITDIDKDGFGFRNIYPVKTKLRLRYSFCFVPCELTCVFVKAIIGEDLGIYTYYPDAFHLDKYLLPVLKTQADYEKMARYIIERDMPEYLDSDKWIFGIEWIQKMGLGVYMSDFPEQGVMGEYFLGFGKAKVLDPETITYKEERINPGTILLNKDIFDKKGRLNAAATHEGIHHRLGYFYFMLQMCHGGCYSYLCKRNDEKQERVTSWTPVEIMELHANKLPAYILIQEKPGRAKAKEFYEGYEDTDEIEKAIKLVNDMAEYFGTTKMIARSRLLEFGYRQVSGISVYLNGHRVKYLETMPTFLILMGACWVINLILIGRIFEIVVYTAVSPIPLSTFAAEGWHDTAKGFIKSYAAVCLQGLVVVLMFYSFSQVVDLLGGTSTIGITIVALSLALGVAKSGQWARQALGCG